MALPSDLVTLATAKAWLELPATTPAVDTTLGMLISQISRKILSDINRPSILPRLFAEVRDGNGKTAMMLRNYPVTSVLSVAVDGIAVPAAPSVTAPGYTFDLPEESPPGSRQSVFLRGHSFRRGLQNASVSYMAGYLVASEPAVAAAAVIVQQPYGPWGSDAGVTNGLTGVALVKVTGAPAAGQYQISSTVVGGYVFSAADAGLSVLISYGFIPADLAEGALEWMAERWAYKGRVGMQSKSLGGQETTSFAITNTPNFIKGILQQYTAVAPL
jgi:hypothetical protein